MLPNTNIASLDVNCDHRSASVDVVTALIGLCTRLDTLIVRRVTTPSRSCSNLLLHLRGRPRPLEQLSLLETRLEGNNSDLADFLIDVGHHLKLFALHSDHVDEDACRQLLRALRRPPMLPAELVYELVPARNGISVASPSQQYLPLAPALALWTTFLQNHGVAASLRTGRILHDRLIVLPELA